MYVRVHCIGRKKTILTKNKDSHCGKDKKNRKEKKSFYCMLDCLQVKVSDRVDGL